MLLLLSLLLLLAVAMLPSQASYVKRYSTITNGAMTFTGNTLGMSMVAQSSVGAFISTDTSLTAGAPYAPRDGTYGTTLDWTKNGASAQLRMTAPYTVLYAELLWAGSYFADASNPNNAFIPTIETPVKFSTPHATDVPITGDPATAKTSFTQGAITKYWYVRSQDVTSLVQAGGVGTYTVKAIPCTIPGSNTNDNNIGWTLAVVYGNPNLPVRNITYFAGGEFTSGSASTAISSIVGFCTPQSGTINGRLLVSTLEGDASITGDTMLFGSTNPPTNKVSGPNNPVGNFFASQINKDDGTLDTAGTAGAFNAPTDGSKQINIRQGWDITNVDVSGFLSTNQNTAYAQGGTTGDAFLIHSLGMQIDVGSPILPGTLAADTTHVVVGSTVTYTDTLNNTGTVDCQNVMLSNSPPSGMSFVAGSVAYSTNGGTSWITLPAADTTSGTGAAIGTIAKATGMLVRYQMKVNAIPVAPAPAQFIHTDYITYFYRSCPLLPGNNGSITTNQKVVLAPRIEPTKTANPPGIVTTGNIITYTINVPNTGLYATPGTTLLDPLPAGVDYVAGSTTLNGTSVPDVGGQMPYATAAGLIKSPSGAAAGNIVNGESAVIVFKVRVNNVPVPGGIITNSATIDLDGSGTNPMQLAVVTNPPASADLKVEFTDVHTQVVAGALVTYNLKISNVNYNGGQSTVNGMNLSLVLPDTLKNMTFVPSSGTYNAVTGSWSGITLPVGGFLTGVLTAKLSSSATGTVAVSATVSNNPGVADPVPANNNATYSDTIINQADLTIAKSDGENVVPSGGQLTYTITVTNNGPSMVNSVKVIDTFPTQETGAVFTPSQGVYNENNGVWTGLALDAGGIVSLQVKVTVTGANGTTLVNTVVVTAPAGVTDPISTNNTAAENTTKISAGASYPVSGTVYNDANHNGIIDAGEIGVDVPLFFMKLIPNGGTAASDSTPLNSDGTYTFSLYSPGTYTLIMSKTPTLTDITPTAPANWVPTAPLSMSRTIVITNAAITGQNFLVYNGSTFIAGLVFLDTGTGAGTPNDAVKNGTEPARAGITIKVTDTTNTYTYDTQVTDTNGNFQLWVPAAAGTRTLYMTHVLPSGYLSTGGNVGNTGGTYDRTTGILSFYNVPGSQFTGVILAEIPADTFSNDGAKNIPAGQTDYFPHVFITGSTGVVTFSMNETQNPVLAGWVYKLYRDINNSGTFDEQDYEITGPMTWTTGTSVSLLLGVTVPAGAAIGNKDTIVITASHSYTNSSGPMVVATFRTDIATAAAPLGVSVAGTIYADVNHNGMLDNAETGTGLTLYAKIITQGNTSANVAILATPASGVYQFPNVTNGSYSIIINGNATLTDITPALPANWLAVMPANLTRTITVTGTAITSIDFGLWNGGKLTGKVLNDNGAGAGTANDAVQNGTEVGISGTQLKLTNSGNTTTYDTTTTDAAGNFTLWIPFTAGATPLAIIETNSPGYVSIGGKVGTTGGVYTRSSDTLLFTNVIGAVYTGVLFADVPANTFTNDGTQTATAGSTVIYLHTFTAGSVGQVNFVIGRTTSPATPAWSSMLYLDTNGNGLWDAGDQPITGPLTATTSGQIFPLILRVSIPPNASMNAQDQLTITVPAYPLHPLNAQAVWPS
ncbi:MAG: SdrD B-like domain-containing protein, partial [bacterium]